MNVINGTFYEQLVRLGSQREEIAPVIKERATDFMRNLNTWQILALMSCLYWALTSLAAYRRIRVKGAPVHGYWSWFEPTWLLQLRYAFTAHKIISSGYLKVCLSTYTDQSENIRVAPLLKHQAKMGDISSIEKNPLFSVVRISTLQSYRPSILRSSALFPTRSCTEERQTSW